MLAAALGTGPAVVGRAPGRRAVGGEVLVGPVILAFGRYTAGARCRLAAAVRWLHEHGAGRVDVVLRDAGSALLVAWPCGVAARRPQSTEGDAVRAAIGVPARLERARSRVRQAVRAERTDPAAVDRAPAQPASRNARRLLRPAEAPHRRQYRSCITVSSVERWRG